MVSTEKHSNITILSFIRLCLSCGLGTVTSVDLTASYDSLGSHPPLKCHSGTRLNIMVTLEYWITSTAGLGMFCSGKSAIAQTICELSAEHNGLLANFFMQGSHAWGSIRNFTPTFTFQVSMSRMDPRSEFFVRRTRLLTKWKV